MLRRKRRELGWARLLKKPTLTFLRPRDADSSTRYPTLHAELARIHARLGSSQLLLQSVTSRRAFNIAESKSSRDDARARAVTGHTVHEICYEGVDSSLWRGVREGGCGGG